MSIALSPPTLPILLRRQVKEVHATAVHAPPRCVEISPNSSGFQYSWLASHSAWLMLEQVQSSVEKLLSATVEVPGENNSLLLVGARGVGKTLVTQPSHAAAPS